MSLHQQFQSRSAIQHVFRGNRAQEALHVIAPGVGITQIKRHGASAEQAARADKHLVGWGFRTLQQPFASSNRPCR